MQEASIGLLSIGHQGKSNYSAYMHLRFERPTSYFSSLSKYRVLIQAIGLQF